MFVSRRRRNLGVSFSPSSLSNLKAWYKADSLGLSDGTKVSSWTDASGNGNHATNGTGATQPVFNTNQINGLPGVNFTTANTTFLTGYSNSNAVIAVTAVFKRTGAEDTGRVIAFSTLAGLFDNTGDTTYKYYANAAVNPVSTGITSTSANVVTLSYDASQNCTISKNGAVVVASFAAFDLYRSPNNLTLGSAGFTSNCSDCMIAEAVVYVPTGSEQHNLEKYLGTKYAITVS